MCVYVFMLGILSASPSTNDGTAARTSIDLGKFKVFPSDMFPITTLLKSMTPPSSSVFARL